MEVLLISLITGAIAVGIFFLVAIMSTLFGAIFGWVVGLFFGSTILTIFAQIGIHDVTMWQIGAFLGFVSAFFKTYKPQNQTKTVE